MCPPDLRADIAKPHKISYTLKAAEAAPAAGTRRAHGRAKLASPGISPVIIQNSHRSGSSPNNRRPAIS